MSKVKRCEDRVHKIEKTEKTETPEWRAHAEGEAYMAWIIRHLTQDEQDSLSRQILAYENDSSMPIAASSTFRSGEERAGTEPAGAYEEFKEKYVRAEVLRHSSRRLTPGERDELSALNAWFYS